VSARENDRIFIRDGLRHYRRTYSMTEVRIGVIIVALLVVIAVWVGWKGTRSDPALFSLDPALLDQGTDNPPERTRPPGARAGSASEPSAREQGETGANERGPVPDGLAAPGWRERSVSSFDSDNLYVKIDGRADYYLAFGFQRMFFVALENAEDEALTVDVEMYDLGSMGNALGAYAGERQPDAQSRLSEAGMGHSSRNAVFLVRGRYYVRAIGADESESVIAALAHLESALDANLPAEPLPWGFAVFAGQMGVDPGKIQFVPANAYSFGFASNVFSAAIDSEGEGDDEGTEMFMVATKSADEAKEMAARFVGGFASYGETLAGEDGYWVKDQYLGNISGATAVRSLVIGVYSAADVDAAKAALARLRETAGSLSDDVLERAAAAASENPAAVDGLDDSHGDGDRPEGGGEYGGEDSGGGHSEEQ
jgi:hypothetical protein